MYTAGITARDSDGHLVGVNNMSAQVEQCFSNLKDVLSAAGADWKDVVKYTFFTVDVERFDKETRSIRSPFFVDRPAATLIEVSRLLLPEMLVEIEAVVCLP